MQHIFRDKETTEGLEGGETGDRRGETRARDELFVVSCTLHPRTLTPRYPVYRVDPLPLTVSSIMSAASASDICTPALFPRKNFTASLREYFLRVLPSQKNTLTLSRKDSRELKHRLQKKTV